MFETLYTISSVIAHPKERFQKEDVKVLLLCVWLRIFAVPNSLLRAGVGCSRLCGLWEFCGAKQPAQRWCWLQPVVWALQASVIALVALVQQALLFARRLVCAVSWTVPPFRWSFIWWNCLLFGVSSLQFSLSPLHPPPTPLIFFFLNVYIYLSVDWFCRVYFGKGFHMRRVLICAFPYGGVWWSWAYPVQNPMNCSWLFSELLRREGICTGQCLCASKDQR